MSKLKALWRWLLAVLFVMVLAVCIILLSGWLARGCSRELKESAQTQTIEEHTDTVTQTAPTPRDSVVVRYEVVTLPRYVDIPRTDTLPDFATTEARDSVTAIVPITQTVYEEDSLYRAYISGFHARLDSITVYPKTRTVTTTVMTTVRQQPKRWSLGLSAGYAMTPDGLKPYVGVGVCYGLVRW